MQLMTEERPAGSSELLGASVREVIQAFEREGELITVPNADAHLEIGVLTEMQALRNGPALMFDPVKGFPAGYRVLSNLQNNPRRVALLMGMPARSRGVDIVRTIRDRFNSLEPIDPVEVSEPTFREVTQRGSDVNLEALPSPFWHEDDGGRYLGTACVVVIKHPDEGWVNLGTYRVQVHD